MEQTALYMSKDVAMEGKLRHVQVVNTMAGRRDQRVSNVRPCVTGHSAWRDAAHTPQHNKRNNGLKAYRLSG
jgi:hypothetical protein